MDNATNSATEATVLDTLTGPERWAFRGDVHESVAFGSRRQSAQVGPICATQMLIAAQLGVFAGAIGFLGVAAEGVAVDHRGFLPHLPEVLLLAAAGIALIWTFHRLRTAKNARQTYVASGLSQTLPKTSGTEKATMAAPMLFVVSFGLLAIDMFVISLTLLNAKYTAPKITGVFIMTISLFPLLLCIWLYRTRQRVLSERAASNQPRAVTS